MKEDKIPAIFKEDLENLLASLKELDPIKAGERQCYVCEKTITLDNLQLLIPREGNRYEYVCNDTACVSDHNSKNISPAS